MDLVALINDHRELTLTPALLALFYLLYKIDRRLYKMEILFGIHKTQKERNDA